MDWVSSCLSWRLLLLGIAWHIALSDATTSPLEQLAILESARLRARHLGSKRAGWTLDVGLLNKSSIVYSFGLGGDISWDLALIRVVGCHVFGFDDTPVSTKFLKGEQAAGRIPAAFHWKRYLLGAADEEMTLSLPTGHAGSYAQTEAGSARGFQNGTQVTAKARTLRSIMQMLSHRKIDLMKMDIEATEFIVFHRILLSAGAHEPAVLAFPVCQLLLEFHSRLSPKGYEAKAEALLALHSLGFTLIKDVLKADGADDAFFINPRFCNH